IEYSNFGKIWNNYFKFNVINAEDNSVAHDNSWDNGTIGNYWDDYTGFDNDGDGLGDTPYSISGSANSKDNYPIWGISKPIINNGDDSSRDDDDNKSQIEVSVFLIILGSIIAASFIAGYYTLQVISHKYSPKWKKGRTSEEPVLGSTPKETDKSTFKPSRPKLQNEVKNAIEKEPREHKNANIEDIDEYFIQEQAINISRRFKNIYEETLREIPLIRKYLESSISIDEIPDGEKLITTILDDNELRKIDKIELSREEKKIFLKELMAMNKKDRNNLLDEMIENS
ncbi:MAG: hypothetical protein GF353_03720, partial [Candidatus Lokiarchaeota archaeon]|nr:hypothetical protein [Candidatus Lokiarchaeota archaeon]